MKNFIEKIKEIQLSGWFAILLALVTPVLAYYGMSGEDFTTWSSVGEIIIKAISNPYVVVLMITSLYSAIQNPKTKGII